MTESRRQDDTALAIHAREEMERYEKIEARLTAIEGQMSSMLEVWTQAKGALTFIKILATIGVALAGIYTFISSNFTFTPK